MTTGSHIALLCRTGKGDHAFSSAVKRATTPRLSHAPAPRHSKAAICRPGMVQLKRDYRLLSLRQCRICTLLYPVLVRGAPPHSHSMISDHRNALFFGANYFCVARRTVSTIRHKFALLISNANFDDQRLTRFRGLSASIGRFLRFFIGSASIGHRQKDRQACVGISSSGLSSQQKAPRTKAAPSAGTGSP
jgi:hypothetical protein